MILMFIHKALYRSKALPPLKRFSKGRFPSSVSHVGDLDYDAEHFISLSHVLKHFHRSLFNSDKVIQLEYCDTKSGSGIANIRLVIFAKISSIELTENCDCFFFTFSIRHSCFLEEFTKSDKSYQLRFIDCSRIPSNSASLLTSLCISSMKFIAYNRRLLPRISSII
uniref:Uncharacterized protein n=1 Tax=Parascaris univalens TaxID=6257 RepID=A0A915AAQ2_PARUN